MPDRFVIIPDPKAIEEEAIARLTGYGARLFIADDRGEMVEMTKYGPPAIDFADIDPFSMSKDDWMLAQRMKPDAAPEPTGPRNRAERRAASARNRKGPR